MQHGILTIVTLSKNSIPTPCSSEEQLRLDQISWLLYIAYAYSTSQLHLVTRRNTDKICTKLHSKSIVWVHPTNLWSQWKKVVVGGLLRWKLVRVCAAVMTTFTGQSALPSLPVYRQCPAHVPSIRSLDPTFGNTCGTYPHTKKRGDRPPAIRLEFKLKTTATSNVINQCKNNIKCMA